ncbi:MAG: DUF669 domain-containing protein [Thermoguttaceae bacterium]
MARIDFNIQEVRPFSGVNQTLPQGVYDVEIIAERILDLRDGRSQGLALDYQVLTGQYRGQRIRDVLNLWHANPDAVNMARSRLAAIAAAVNVQALSDTSDLQRKPFRILLSTRVYNAKEYNNVDEYMPAPTPAQGARAPARLTRPAPVGRYEDRNDGGDDSDEDAVTYGNESDQRERGGNMRAAARTVSGDVAADGGGWF